MEKEIWKKVAEIYFKSATAWIKYLRHQLDNSEFTKYLLISTRFIEFLKLNLVLFRDSLNQEEITPKPSLKDLFLSNLTWFLAEASLTEDA